MTANERDVLLRNWEPLENSAIVKEVATKGKHIALAISFMAKRMSATVDQAKEYFQREVNDYVFRLLTNGQVFRAEHVLKNLDRVPKYMFYEFMATGDETATRTAGSSTKDIIINYLQKNEPHFDEERIRFDIELQMLATIVSDSFLRTKYAAELPTPNLEALYKCSDSFRRTIEADCLFVAKNSRVIPILQKLHVWSYLLVERKHSYLIKWLTSLRSSTTELVADHVNSNVSDRFEAAVVAMFATWTVDDAMMEQLNQYGAELNECVRDALARNGKFLDTEYGDSQQMLRRVFATESWPANAQLMSLKVLIKDLVTNVIMKNGLMALLMHDFIDTDVLHDLLTSYPNQMETIELCIALKECDSHDVLGMSTEVSKYIVKHDAGFYEKNPHVFLVELLLQNPTVASVVGSPHTKHILSRIPIVDAFLKKLSTSTTQHDQTSTLHSLVMQFKRIDLHQISAEAGDEPLNFSNSNLLERYGQPKRLGYMHFVRQRRSSYAVYVFLLEQLQQFAQINPGQILYACSCVADLALAHHDDVELVVHCMAFIEMLGMNSVAIRAHLKCLRMIKASRPDVQVASIGDDELLRLIEEVHAIGTNDLEALSVVYETRQMKMPESFLRQKIEQDNWYQFTVFAMYHDYPLNTVLAVLNESSDGCDGRQQISMNMERALRFDVGPERCRRNSSLKYRENRKKLAAKLDMNLVASAEPSAAATATLSSSISSSETSNQSKPNPVKFLYNHTDLFATILKCTTTVNEVAIPLEFGRFHEILQSTPATKPESTQLNLLNAAVQRRWPLLAILSAMEDSHNHDYCWFTWLSTSVDCFAIPATPTSFDTCTTNLIESCVRTGFVRTLHQSVQIFYANSNFGLFTEYLWYTTHYDFSAATTQILQRYLMTIGHDECTIPPLGHVNVLDFTVALLVLHLQHGFDSLEHRQLLLDSLCASGISDFMPDIDFCTVRAISGVLSFTGVNLYVERFMRNHNCDADIKRECERIIEALVAEREYGKAMEAADLLRFPKDNIIFESWVWEYEQDAGMDLGRCEREIGLYSLSPELVVNFYVHVADKLAYEDARKYGTLKMVMDVIKKHHLFLNESFNCDRIEYEMIISFLRNAETVRSLDVYYSEYFESIMRNERAVLYKTFHSLKEMAGVDDLAVYNRQSLTPDELSKLEDLINTLLDAGDIVQALRIQAIFNHRTLDLHFLVYCMALAEGLATLFDLSLEQRQMLSDGAKAAISKFNRRTLRSARTNQASGTPSPTRPSYLDTSDHSATLEFEEIPSREKQDVLETLQSLAGRISHGTKIAQRIVMTWRAAMYLDKEYSDVLKTKDPYLLLDSAIQEDCINKLVVMNDIMTSTAMTHQEIADFLAEKIANCIIKSNFYLLQQQSSGGSAVTVAPITMITSHLHHQHTLWGYDLDKEFRLFLELSPNTSALGNRLLKYCDALKVYRKFDAITAPQPDRDEESAIRKIFQSLKEVMSESVLSHKKQNTICVELLIKAHDCFVHECYMEGIACVLQRTKQLNGVLANAKSWRLIVKMLMGIGRYRDMYYCFETLIKNDQFESLLGHFVDDERIHGFKQAIISYLHENCPDNTEFYRLAALHFLMYKEIAQMWETEARRMVARVISEQHCRVQSMGDEGASSSDDVSVAPVPLGHLRCSTDVMKLLGTAMDGYAHAAENCLLDNKLAMAQRMASMAELLALQIDLMRRALEKRMAATSITTTTTTTTVSSIASAPMPTVPGAQTTCICVVNIQVASVLRHFVNNNLSVPQALILSRAYPFEINWTEAIFRQFVVRGNDKYLADFCDRMDLTEPMIEAIVKKFQHQTNVTRSMEQCIATLVDMVETVTLRYKLASLLGLKRCIANLINEPSVYYLKDTNYGRNEIDGHK